MFAFTKEQKQAKLAKANVDNYNKLSEQLQHSYSNDLYREAISNAMADIVDIFTILRSSYDLSKPIKTLEDYRLLRVPGMPGIVIDYKWIADEAFDLRYSHYINDVALNNSSNLQPYLIKALIKRNLTKMEANYKHKADKYSITLPFSEDNYDTLFSLESIIQKNYPNMVTSNYNREICQQFAHTANKDILISI